VETQEDVSLLLFVVILFHDNVFMIPRLHCLSNLLLLHRSFEVFEGPSTTVNKNSVQDFKLIMVSRLGWKLTDIIVAHQLPVCLVKILLILLQLHQLFGSGKVLLYGNEPIRWFDSSHISWSAIPNSPIGMKKVFDVGEYISIVA